MSKKVNLLEDEIGKSGLDWEWEEVLPLDSTGLSLCYLTPEIVIVAGNQDLQKTSS